MDTLMGTERYCLYQGRQYVMRSSGWDLQSREGIVTIKIPEGLSASDFSESIGSGGEGDDQWVVLPERLVSREWVRKVYGEWRGVVFQLKVSPGRTGPVLFGYTSDPAAGLLGIPGDQYQAWGGPLPADEVVITRQVERELPMG